MSGENTGERTTARKCPPDKIAYDPGRGIKICTETGEVIEEDMIGDEAEWRAYTPEERTRRTRVGSPIQFSKPNLGVDVYISASRGSRVKGLSKRLDYLRTRGLRGKAALTSLEKNINQALRYIDDISARLELPRQIKEEAARLYREAANKGLTRGRSIESMVAASLYAACRKHRYPCTLEDIAKNLSMKEIDAKREVARNYRLLVKQLDVRIPVIDAERFVYRIASALGLPDPVVAEAINIVKMSRGKGLTAGKDPSGLAAAAVYLAALKHGIRKTQKEVALVAGVTEVTVRNRYKEIDELLKQIGYPV